ncbi:MAG: ribosomal subunit interface protein [Halobacteriovorax sp.]|nr:ribosomal subunit interface protein [Halobacteriovorax sp.]|tara:strand:+ start:18445 stop:18852 length:408 start_codon:yes stop_codon:yes gene_type:complete
MELLNNFGDQFMKITIEFQHLEHTPALDERIREKSEKLNKYLDGNTHIKWHCFTTDQVHHAEVSLFGLGQEFHAKAGEDSLYKSIDKIMERLEKQLVKKKEKVKNRIHRKHHDPVHLDPEDAWQDHDEDDFDDVG